ncbi:MAG: hypothetical protein QM831_37655 [Kofleriaceae bacterium]
MHSLALVAAVAFATGPARKPATDDVWHGTYVCAQGKTAVTVRLHHDGDSVTGTFEFGPVPENPNVPHGLYEIKGSIHGDSLTIEAGAWIEHPDHYVTVGFTGEMTHDHRLFHGHITFGGCGDIDLAHN